jgi:ABC-type transporter Mla MlaB component
MQPTFSYYMHDGSTAFSFELAGDLSDEGARELEQAWRTATSVIGEKELLIDLSYVSGIDEAGCELLNKWHAHGARLVVISPEAKKRIQSMTDRPVMLRATIPKAFTWRPFRTAALWLVASSMLLFPATATARSTKSASGTEEAAGRGILSSCQGDFHEF